MKRRNLFRIFGVIALGTISRWSDAEACKSDATLEFFIAGARFHCPDKNTLNVGDTVSLIAEHIDESVAIAIFSPAGEKIGYAPASQIHKLIQNNVHLGILTKANHFSLPWKQYRVRVTA